MRDRLLLLAEGYASLMEQGPAGRLRRLLYNRHPIAFALAYLGLHRWFDSHDLHAATFWDRKLVLPSGDGDSIYPYCFGMLGGAWEYPLTMYLIKNLRPDDVFYDVGAHHGFYSFLAEEIITEGEIHAFEPAPRICAYLRRNLRDGKDNRIKLNEVALSDRPASGIAFYDSYNSRYSGTSSLLAEAAGRGLADGHEAIRVDATTLDEYAKTHRPPNLIKIDVEGAEWMVIEGGLSTIRKSAPVIVLEVWKGKRGKEFSLGAASELKRAGYQPYRIDPQGHLGSAPADIAAVIASDGAVENLVFSLS